MKCPLMIAAAASASFTLRTASLDSLSKTVGCFAKRGDPSLFRSWTSGSTSTLNSVNRRDMHSSAPVSAPSKKMQDNR